MIELRRITSRSRAGLAPVLLAFFCSWSVFSQSSRPGMGSIPYSDAAGTGVTFRVWAPNASTVAVPGSFNGWSATANFLVKEGSSGLWSADVPTARAGHEYKYLINSSIWKRDPRGRKVVSSAGNTIVYSPNGFNWRGDTRLAVNASDLVIYELHVGAFYDSTPASGGPGKFADTIVKLDYLTNLGINAVELMPLAEFAGDYSWGYNPADPYAVENSGYGGPDGLKSLVRAAHQRGIHVLLDVVHNHYGPSDLDLWGFDIGAEPGIYFYSASGICCSPWGNRPNYGSEGVRSYIIDSFRMWLDEYHLDGFRWDAVGAMRHYDPGYVSIPEADSLISYINSAVVHAEHPGAISIAEDDSGGMHFDSEWARGYADTLIATMASASDTSRDMVALQSAISGSGFARVVYSENHDLVGSLNGTGAQRLPKRIHLADPEGYFARKRSMLAAAIVMSSPGIPMLFMGQEMLAVQQFSDNSQLDWTQVTTQVRVVNFYRDLIRLRRNLDSVSLGFKGPNLSWHVVDNNAKVLAFHRWGAGPDDQVMVIINCSNTTLSDYAIDGFPASGTWYVNLNSDWTRYSADFGNRGSYQVPVAGSSGSITIGPYSVLILSRSELPNLDSDADGLLNRWEERYFGNPISAEAASDDDDDGATNIQEQAADTNPRSPDSVLRFTGVERIGPTLVLSWQGGQSARQLIQESATLTGPWVSIYTNPPPTLASNYLNITAPINAVTFYRIQIQ